MDSGAGNRNMLRNRIRRDQSFVEITTTTRGYTLTVDEYPTTTKTLTGVATTGGSALHYSYSTITAYSASTVLPVQPLTTIFTPPSNCLNDIISSSGLWIAPGFMSSCFPSGFVPGMSYTFSPGICPSGYWYPDQSVNQQVMATTTLQETAMACCPSHYTYLEQSAICKSWIGNTLSVGTSSPVTLSNTLITTIPRLSYTTYSSGTSAIMTRTLSDNVQLTRDAQSSDYVLAEAIYVQYQSTDSQILALLATQSSTGQALNATSINTPEPGLHGSSLAAAIVAPLLFSLMVLGAAIFLFRRRSFKKYRSVKIMQEDDMPDQITPQIAELHTPFNRSSQYESIAIKPDFIPYHSQEGKRFYALPNHSQNQPPKRSSSLLPPPKPRVPPKPEQHNDFQLQSVQAVSPIVPSQVATRERPTSLDSLFLPKDSRLIGSNVNNITTVPEEPSLVNIARTPPLIINKKVAPPATAWSEGSTTVDILPQTPTSPIQDLQTAQFSTIAPISTPKTVSIQRQTTVRRQSTPRRSTGSPRTVNADNSPASSKGPGHRSTSSLHSSAQTCEGRESEDEQIAGVG
ncbi:hypothetical protein BT63DRAFT_418131 [Microthyrium microscopicum]|uniref:Uncharacterized protein n=1 Tax=Microthyrium microscopicum TaxID=703497 RepID=A0A6A6U0L4_9PEZI|nr:hypothetical protein BT63DRAFT_418131 [Microthyrium microscopicum]